MAGGVRFLRKGYQENLSALIHESTFKKAAGGIKVLMRKISQTRARRK